MNIDRIFNLSNSFYKLSSSRSDISNALSLLGLTGELPKLNVKKVNDHLQKIIFTSSPKLTPKKVQILENAADEIISYLRNPSGEKKSKEKFEDAIDFLKKFNLKTSKRELIYYIATQIFAKIEIGPDDVDVCSIDEPIGLVIYGKNKYYLISEYYDELVDYSKLTYVTLAKGGIPRLYIHEMAPSFDKKKDEISLKILEKINAKKTEPVTEKSVSDYPELAGYYWLAGPIAKLTNFTTGKKIQDFKKINNSKFIYFFKKFVENNKQTLDKINFYRKIIQPEKINAISGSDGVALSIANDLILKLHTSKDLFDKEMELTLDIYYKYPKLVGTQTRIYDNGCLGTIKNNLEEEIKIYYSIIEKVKPILSEEQILKKEREDLARKGFKVKIEEYSEDFKNKEILTEKIQICIEKLELFVLKNISLIESIKKEDDLKKQDLITDLVNKAKSEISIDSSLDSEIKILGNLNNDWFDRLKEEYIIKFSLGKRDLFVRNLGINSSGYLSFFDPYSKEYEDMKPGDPHWR